MAKKSMTSRQVQAQETANRIYAAAIELMDRRGFERITIADISQKAGVSVGAFYHYFDSKDDILAEIFRRADEYFSTQVASHLKARKAPNQIVEYFDHYARFNVQSGVDLTRQLFNPKIKFFGQKNRSMLVLLEDIIRRGQEKGEIRDDRDPQEIVRFLFMMARGIVFDWSLYDGKYDLAETMRAYMTEVVSTLAT